MLVIRILGTILLIVIAASVLMYLFTKNHRYLAFCGQMLKIGLIVALVIGAIFIVERFIIR